MDGKEVSHTQYDNTEPHMEFVFTDHAVHKQVIRLLLVCAKRQFTKREMVSVRGRGDGQVSCRSVLQELVIQFFKLTPNFIDSAEIVGVCGTRDG